MGLFRKSEKIAGTAQIISCSGHRGESRWQNCQMHLVVRIDGRDPYPAEVSQIVSRVKWPQPGMQVPVEVKADDPMKVKVDFDEMQTNEERAREMAEQQAQAMRDPGSMAGGMAGGFPGATAGGMPGWMPFSPNEVTIVGDINQVPKEKLARLEQMTGMDLDGDGVVGGTGGAESSGPAGGTSSGGEDRVAQLERLAQLRASGALTESEFRQEKRRPLES